MKIRPLTGFIIVLLLATAINAANVFSIASIRPVSQMAQLLATTAPDFALSVSPNSQTISQGESASYQVTITSFNGFASSVWLSISGLPSGATYSWSTNPVSPPSNGQAQSTLLIATSLTVSTGTFSISVAGSSGTLFHTQYISLSINAATTAQPDFTISASPNSLTIRAGSSGTYLITLTSVYGFNSPVSLGISGLPQGISYNFNPFTVIPTGSSELTIAVPQTTSTTTMSYTLTITGTGGGRTHSATVTLYVTPTFMPDFTISVYPLSQMITPGQTVTYTVTLTSIYGFSSSVSLSATGLPATAISYFDPQSAVPPGASKLTITLPISAATTATTVTYTIMVTGMGAGISHSTSATLYVVPQAPTASWTFMVYMDGDNDLENWWIQDFNLMEEVGSTAEVNIVVLFDRYSTNEAILYYIARESPPTSSIVSSEIENWGSVNMGDPETLRHFISWAATSYKASHYALVLQDHGGGFTGVCWDYHSGWISKDRLTMKEIRNALSDAGIYFEVIIFYACMMQMAEVAYQIKDFSHYTVGSEEIAYTGDINYDLLLTDLVNHPDMSGRQFAISVVTNWRKWSGGTISAIDLWQMDELAASLNDFAEALISSLPNYRSQMQTNRRNTDHYRYSFFIDLYHFAELIQQDPSLSNTVVGTTSKSVMKSIEKAVIFNWRGEAHFNSHGSSIYFPETGYIDYYDDLIISQLIQWDEFVKAYEYS